MQRLRLAYLRTPRRLIARARRALLLGIAGRLALAFGAVSVLAVTANLVVERGVRVVQSTRLDRGQYSPVPASAANAAATAASFPPAEAADPAPQARRRSALSADVSRFASAIDRFQASTEVRASSETLDSADEMGASERELKASAAAVRRLLPRPAQQSQLDAAVLGYGEAGTGYLEAADTRRHDTREYVGRLDAIDGRVTVSLGRGWKLFGRVLARASLLRLHSDIEALRHRMAAAGGPDNLPASLPEIAESELALRRTYESSEPGLARSEGAEWTRHTHEDFERMAQLRESISAANGRFRDGARALAAAKARLSAAVSSARAAADAAADTPPSPSLGATGGAGGTGATGARIPLSSAAMSSPVIAAVTTTTTTTDTQPDTRRRITVAGITAAVLAVLSAISVWTMRSILVPVGRIVEATRKLAGGDVAVRVPRGGMKELDSLAAAFNRMAAQLKTARDITLDYRQHLEAQVEQRTRQLRHLAERDSLTLLANRRRFFVLLNQSMERAGDIECGVAVFFIDLDNFKNLNDGMGHGFGDRVLISVAQRLEETAAPFGFAARLGGDEFTVVHEEIFSLQDAHDAGRKLVEAFHRPLEVEGREITVSVSVGASVYPEHERRAEDLLSAADAALFRAKALGRNQLSMYTPELLESATRKFTTEQGIRHALEHDHFELMFQPEVSTDTLEVSLVEALVRWRLPDGRLATPDEFLAVTEESGLILDLGDWVLRNALQAASSWHHGPWPTVTVAINVSARQLIDHRFVQRVQELVREFRLPATCIELELTESVLQTGASTIESLRQLRSLGIAIALDDFGTGYSSFASLERLPLSRIKLDRSLIAGIDSNPRSAAIAFALIRLCDELGIEVTAEGVERESQFACLVQGRSMHLQGYLISRPVTHGEIAGVKRLMPQVMHDLLLRVPRSKPPSSPPTRKERQDPTQAVAKR